LSQIELRIAAELSGDRAMLSAFNSGVDVHWLTAIREIARGGGLATLVKKTASKYAGKAIKNYGKAIELLLEMGHKKAIEIDERWKENRKKAKATNFGYLYGMWWKKFKAYARDNYGVHLTEEQAQESRKAFFDIYSDLPDWHRRQKMFARRNGFVRSLSGRKRRLPAATASYDSPIRQAAERQGINSPVQSFANELNLMALIQLYDEFPRHRVKIVGTVHDAVLFMVKEKYVEPVVTRMLEIMSHPKLLDELGIKLQVPVEAEAQIGSWSNGKDLQTWLKAA
jgi:DNA polymerase-1